MQPETKSKILGAVLGACLSAGLTFISQPFLREFWDFLADIALPRLSKRGQLSLLATLSAVCTVLVISLHRARSRRVLLAKYEHLKERGFWKNRKTGQYVCGNCL